MLDNPPKPFPLTWPLTFPRTPPEQRLRSKFRVDASQARNDLIAATRRLAEGRPWVISSNLPTRSDGVPLANQSEPKDPGVAVYWADAQNAWHSIPCDRWRTVRENMRAATSAIEGFRQVQRSGAGQVVDRVFAGLALPEKASGGAPWWETLGVPSNASPAVIKDAYRELCRLRHPDRGGTLDAWNELNRAYAAALPSGAA